LGFSKLREWVGTVTGKGDRWGRDREGWSEPAFLSANTFALPPSTCTARREAGQHRRQLLFLLRGRPTAGRCVSSRPVPGGEYAGCVCLQWPCSAGCVPAHLCLCHAHCPSHRLPPFSSFCLLCPCSCPCAPGSSSCEVNQHVCKLLDCPVGSCNTGLQWRPVRRCLTYLFPAESMILGHGFSVKL